MLNVGIVLALLFLSFLAALVAVAVVLTDFFVSGLGWTWLLVCDSGRGIGTVLCFLVGACVFALSWSSRNE